MPGGLSKGDLAAALAAKSGLTKKVTLELLDHLAQLSYEHANETFTIPGIGKMIVTYRKSRKGRNPQTKAPMQIPAKKVLKFRFAQAAEDAILGPN